MTPPNRPSLLPRNSKFSNNITPARTSDPAQKTTDTSRPTPPVPAVKRWRTNLLSRLPPRLQHVAVKAFSMQRYKVTVVAPGTTEARPVLLVPFQPDALVTAFIDELYRRIARQGLAITPNTHIATLHLDGETGALIDAEDLLADVISDPKSEQIVSVFSKKDAKVTAAATTGELGASVTKSNTEDVPSLSIRLVTPALANERQDCPVLQVPLSATVKQLHERIAAKLEQAPNFDQHADSLECNCTWANQVSTIATPPNTLLVVSGKSDVHSITINTPTEAAVKAALRAHLGPDYELTKRLALVGANMDIITGTYKKVPVAAICSRQRHTPVHARVDIDETGHRRSKVLDLHTAEIPISPACMDATLEEVGLAGLNPGGVVDLYAVSRTTTGQNAQAIGKSSVFRARAHWEPRVVQSDRGMAMFLSSLRVFASLVQEMGEDERSQDAILHAFDLLTNFPPALRALYVLVQGKTPTAVESAAFSSAMFQALDSFAPHDIIGTDQSRVFELSRLFLGFVLEKARTFKLPEDGDAQLPYLTSLQSTVDLADSKTGEAVMRAVQTSQGVVEATVFDAFQDGGVLSASNLSSRMTKLEVNADLTRLAFLNGGTTTTITAFSKITDYRYGDNGDINAAIDLGELSELSHLAELCGRNKLAVHRPSQLSSAVTPCLTFDRNAHLAVYTGEQPCGDPGHSSILFRPQHGDETIDSSVVEQLIAPIIQSYEADGTAVFDSLGGAAVRRLQAPDEILMFCVDCSASMRQPTDFREVNDDVPLTNPDSDIQSYVDAEFYTRASYDDMKDYLCRYEGFDDLVAIVGSADEWQRDHIVRKVLKVLRDMLSTEIIKKTENIDAQRSNRFLARSHINALVTELDRIKAFWAGLTTHEVPVHDFVLYRATARATDISQRWTWSIGDALPAFGPIYNIPELPSNVTDLPDHLRCPISHTLMEDAVRAADGHIYSATAIRQWFSIRRSSPMTGLGLQDTTLSPDASISEAASSWEAGDGIVGRGPPDQQASKRARSDDLEVTFESRLGSFKRNISSNLNLKQLYMLAFRGLKGRAMVFQLTTERYGALTPTPDAVVSSRNIRDGDHITVRIAEDEPTGVSTAGIVRSHDEVLIKLYEDNDDMLFGYWAKRDTTQTMASVLWKYWRYIFSSRYHVSTKEKQVWVNMSHSGDGLMTGNPKDNTEMLATYFTRAHCFGHLGEEKVYREDERNRVVNTGSQPLVLKVKINSVHRPHAERAQLTRLGVLKQMFEAVINRMLAYNYNTHCGLITFASSPKLEMKISHVMENFRRATQGMRAEGDTSLWDALALGNDQLVEYGKKYPEAKKRIICISDGDDTKSATNKPDEICYRLREAKVAIDTIALGNEDNADLRTISHLLGGYSLHPTSLINALAITEMEPFLALSERPAIAAPVTPAHRLQFMGHFWRVKPGVRHTVVTADQVPPRKEHPNLYDDFVQVNAMAARPHNNNNAGNRRSNLRTSRLLIEMRWIAAGGSHPKYDVYVSESDMSFWKVVMEGPDDSPYSEGTFVLYIDADEGYPTFAPKARFITKVKHPNVNAHGRICHSILTRDWTSDIKMTTLIDSIYGLLLQPEHSDPVSTIATLGFHHDQVEFADEVRDHVNIYASKSREQWRKELLGEEDEDMDGEE